MQLTIRDAYANIDLEKSYTSLFELLWYSQLPCFDVMNITTKDSEDHGKKWVFVKFLQVEWPFEYY